MNRNERRQAPRKRDNLLTSLRLVENGVVTWTGFARTLNLSLTGALIETPDRFRVGQNLVLEFLVDDDRIAEVEAKVSRVTPTKNFNHMAVEFVKIPAKAKRLLDRQLEE